MANKKISSEIRFWKKVEKFDKDLCWIWTGGTYYNGYGQFFENPNKITAHRFSYELHYGKIQNKKLYVCHKCDNRKCVNPDHLFLGTQKENLEDMLSKNRGNYPGSPGEKNGRAIVSKKIVKEMRKLHKTGKYTYIDLSKKFNISETQTHRIIKKESWKNI